MAIPMKTHLIKFTSQLIRNLPAILAGLFTAIMAFNTLPNAWSADLFWTGQATGATPAVAGSGDWADITTEFPAEWSTTSTSTANTGWHSSTPDVAHFLGSGGGTVTLLSNITAAGINFDSGANSFTIDTNRNNLTIQGTGIVNNSGRTQTITNPGRPTATSSPVIGLIFSGTAITGSLTINNNAGTVSGTGSSTSGGFTDFNPTSNAGSATINNNGGTVQFSGGGTAFGRLTAGTANAGNATINNNAGTVANSGGFTNFNATSTAGSATITNNGGTIGGSPGRTNFFGGLTNFFDSSTAGSARITNNGGTAAGSGGLTRFFATSNAGSATIISNGGMVAGSGGITLFFDSSDGGTARAITNGNGRFDISGLTTGGMGIGSIEGSGNYFLGSKTLTVGGNNLSTTVSGLIQDGGLSGGTGGSLTKLGTGTLILTGNNTYSGGTTIGAGTLQLGNGGTSGNIAGNVADNGTLAFDRSDVLTFDGAISGSGGVTQIGTGTTILTANNSYNGGTTISAGTLQLGNGGTTGSITGNVIDNGILAFNRSDVFSFGGVISGTGGVNQIGTGTTILTGNNTYTGATIISAGTLQAGSTSAFGVNSELIVNSILDVHGFNNVIGSLSGSGTVLNNGGTVAALTVGNDNSNSSFSGVLENGTSALRLIKSGTGVLTLTGNNIYNGGTTISAGTLQLGNGGTTGSITGNVIDNGTLAFNRSDVITFGGVISGTGGLQQNGTGTTVLVADNTYTGTTTVNSGSLIVDGSISSPQTFVNAGGFLGGHGTIGGNVLNSGTVGQFNSPGTLSITGNYTQNPSGTLQIQIAGLGMGQHDLLAVNGHAALAGTLQLNGVGGFNLQPGNQITFLTANNGVSGTFSNVSTGTIVQGQVTSLANSVVLTAVQGSFATTPGVATTPNNFAVAKALDSAAGDPRAAALFAFLNSQPLASLPHDLALIAPTQISSMNATTVAGGNVQASNVGQRLNAVRGGSTGFSSSGFGISGAASDFGDGFAGVSGPEGKSGPSVLAPVPENRWGVFLTGLGEFTNVDSTSNAPGYDVDTGGFTLGVDYRLTPNFAIGLFGGYAHTNVNLVGGGNIDVNAGKIGAYATIFGNGFYLDAAVSGGPSGYDTRRVALQGNASGSTDGADLNVLVAGGYDWKVGNLSIGPTASFQFSYVGLDSFTETGSLAPLKFPDQNTESERTAFGAKAYYQWKVGHITVIPQVTAAWQHEYGSVAYSVVASFASGAGNSFTVNGPEIGRDSLLIGAGVSVLWSDRISTYVYYDGDVARTNYDSHSVSGGIRITF
jgi:autotransporter-associated beta strand protein